MNFCFSQSLFYASFLTGIHTREAVVIFPSLRTWQFHSRSAWGGSQCMGLCGNVWINLCNSTPGTCLLMGDIDRETGE